MSRRQMSLIKRSLTLLLVVSLSIVSVSDAFAQPDLPDYAFTTPVFDLAVAPDGSLLVADAGAGIVELRKGEGTLVAELLAITTFGVLFFLRGRRIPGGFLVVAVVLSLVSGLWVIPLTNYAPLLIAGLVLVMRPGRPLEAGTPARRPVST